MDSLIFELQIVFYFQLFLSAMYAIPISDRSLLALSDYLGNWWA